MAFEPDGGNILSDLQYLKDRQQILDCIVRESRGRDRHDSELIASAYWEDGSNERGLAKTPALEFPENTNAAHARGFSSTNHNLSNHTCEIEGDVAYCETYVLGSLLSPDAKSCKIVPSRYIDKLVRRNGEWRILSRRTVIDAVLEGDASWLESDALRNFLKGTRNRNDPSYRHEDSPASTEARW